MNTNLENINNDNFDIVALTNLVGTSAMTVNQMSRQMGILNSAMENINGRMNNVEADIEELKYNTEVTSNQAQKIKDIAAKKIMEIFDSNNLDRDKYYSIFIRRLYSESKKYSGLGATIYRTLKGDFQRTVNFIESWTPKCGILELKNYADEKAENKKILREQGYDC